MKHGIVTGRWARRAPLLADISPGSAFLTERTQFHTLLPGKHPNMVAALIVLEGSPTSGGVAARTACEGGYCGPYNLRAGPGTGYSVTGSVGGGVSVAVVCQANGTSHTGPWGTTSLRNRLGGSYAGKWISDAFVYTGSAGMVAPPC